MTYASFIENVKNEELPGTFVLKENRVVSSNEDGEVELLLDSIRKDLSEPEFYSNFALLETIELMQGAVIKEKPHYEKSEQFMCLVEGEMSIIMVPHVFRQEVSGGKYSDDYKELEGDGLFLGLANTIKAINSSPINFFYPNIR